MASQLCILTALSKRTILVACMPVSDRVVDVYVILRFDEDIPS